MDLFDRVADRIDEFEITNISRRRLVGKRVEGLKIVGSPNRKAHQIWRDTNEHANTIDFIILL